jgi:hypothetical protein
MFVANAAGAASIIDEWATVEAPAPPALKPVTIDRTTTALRLLDFNKQACNSERRPRCIASIPKVAKLLASARMAPCCTRQAVRQCADRLVGDADDDRRREILSRGKASRRKTGTNTRLLLQ